MARAARRKAAKTRKVSSKKRTKKPAVPAKLSRYFQLVLKNTPSSLEKAARLIRTFVQTPVTATEKAYLLVVNWRNGVDSNMTECMDEFGESDPLACAHRWADKAIELGPRSPYGYWAKAYVYKYQSDAQSSAFYYQLAAHRIDGFLGGARKKKHFIVDWVESQIYWLPQGSLSDLLPIIDDNLPVDPPEKWINWVKCFALHMMQEYRLSNDLYPRLPNDKDTSLVIAANYFRVGDDAQRLVHKTRFLSKPGNEHWTPDDEMRGSPFIDPVSKVFWYQSVSGALA